MGILEDAKYKAIGAQAEKDAIYNKGFSQANLNRDQAEAAMLANILGGTTVDPGLAAQGAQRVYQDALTAKDNARWAMEDADKRSPNMENMKEWYDAVAEYQKASKTANNLDPRTLNIGAPKQMPAEVLNGLAAAGIPGDWNAMVNAIYSGKQ